MSDEMGSRDIAGWVDIRDQAVEESIVRTMTTVVGSEVKERKRRSERKESNGGHLRWVAPKAGGGIRMQWKGSHGF
jgi:hypothetical protein